MLDMERVRLTKIGKSPADVNTSHEIVREFDDLCLIGGMTPGEIVAGCESSWRSERSSD